MAEPNSPRGHLSAPDEPVRANSGASYTFGVRTSQSSRASSACSAGELRSRHSEASVNSYPSTRMFGGRRSRFSVFGSGSGGSPSRRLTTLPQWLRGTHSSPSASSSTKSKRNGFSFKSVCVQEAIQFVQRKGDEASTLVKYCRTGFFTKRVIRKVWVDPDRESIVWNTHRSADGGGISLSSLVAVNAVVLDEEQRSRNRKPDDSDEITLSSSSSSAKNVLTRSLSSMSPRKSHWGASFNNLIFGAHQELQFEIIHVDAASKKQKNSRVLFQANSRSELKLWVTGLQSYVLDRQCAFGGMNVDSSMRTLFRKYDANGDGVLQLAEARSLFQKVGAYHRCMSLRYQAFFDQYDVDGDGCISEEEFVSLFYSMLQKEVLSEFFSAYSCLAANGQEERDLVDAFCCLSIKQLKSFLTEVQRDVSTDLIALDSALEKLQSINGMTSRRGKTFAITEMGFTVLMTSSFNSIVDPAKACTPHDMTRPLSKYWIACSHNTYLDGKQIAGTASVAQYIDVIRRGCRCVEVDCWDGRDGEPVVTHAYASSPWLKLSDVIRACRDHAFVHTDYPLILSIEMRCGVEQQVRCGEIFETILGPMLLRLPECGLANAPLDSPLTARNKIIVKAKPSSLFEDEEEHAEDDDEDDDEGMGKTMTFQNATSRVSSMRQLFHSRSQSVLIANKSVKQAIQRSVSGRIKMDERRSQSEDGVTRRSKDSSANVFGHSPSTRSNRSTASRKRKNKLAEKFKPGLLAYNANIYLNARKLNAEVPARELGQGRFPCNITSFKEVTVTKHIRNLGDALKEYHDQFLTRVYPGMTATNLKPMAPWLHGVQLVALNYQNYGDATLLNEGMFRHQNGGCGYVLKPESVSGLFRHCQCGRLLKLAKPRDVGCPCAACGNAEPVEESSPGFKCEACASNVCDACALKFAKERRRGIRLRLKVLSGHFLPLISNPVVCMQIHGCSSDCSTKETSAKMGNGYNPRWDESFEFEISQPEVAILTFHIRDHPKKEDGALFAAPLSVVREGVRWVQLWDLSYNPMENSGLLVEIRISQEAACSDVAADFQNKPGSDDKRPCHVVQRWSL